MNAHTGCPVSTRRSLSKLVTKEVSSPTLEMVVGANISPLIVVVKSLRTHCDLTSLLFIECQRYKENRPAEWMRRGRMKAPLRFSSVVPNGYNRFCRRYVFLPPRMQLQILHLRDFSFTSCFCLFFGGKSVNQGTTTVFERTGFNSVLLSMTVVPIPGGCAKTVFLRLRRFNTLMSFIACELRRDIELFQHPISFDSSRTSTGDGCLFLLEPRASC